MNQKVIKFVQILAILSLVFLSACGGGAQPQSGGGPSTGIPSNTGGSASASDEEPIKLGFILSLSGNFAFMGRGVQRGIELYFEQNGNKIGDRDVILYFEDDGGDPQTALRKYQQLTLNEDVDFIGGGTIGSISNALRDVAESERKVPMLNIVGSVNGLSWENKSDYFWRVGMSSWQYGATLGKYAAEKVGKTAVVVASDYVSGHEIAADFIARFEEAGGEVKHIIWAPVGTSDFSSYLTEINKMAPDLVYLYIPGADGPRFIQQYKEFGLNEKFQLLESSAMLNAPSTVNAVGDAVVGARMIVHYYPELDNELNKKFYNAFYEKYNQPPDYTNVNGYDAAKVMEQVILAADSLEAEDLVAAMKAGISFDSPRGPITLDPLTYNPIQNMYILEGINDNGNISFKLLEVYENVQMPAESPDYY